MLLFPQRGKFGRSSVIPVKQKQKQALAAAMLDPYFHFSQSAATPTVRRALLLASMRHDIWEVASDPCFCSHGSLRSSAIQRSLRRYTTVRSQRKFERVFLHLDPHSNGLTPTRPSLVFTPVAVDSSGSPGKKQMRQNTRSIFCPSRPRCKCPRFPAAASFPSTFSATGTGVDARVPRSEFFPGCTHSGMHD